MMIHCANLCQSIPVDASPLHIITPRCPWPETCLKCFNRSTCFSCFNLQSANIVIIFDWSQRKSHGNHSPTVTWDINIPIYSIRVIFFIPRILPSKNWGVAGCSPGREARPCCFFLSHILENCIRFEEIDPVIICNCQVSNALILRLHLPTHQVVKTQMFNTRPQET